MGGRKKGLSVDEKRTKLKELLLETKVVYTLKDLEKLAPKSKGITQQSVKDILQSLVDDNEVKSDKIGTSNYFWCFPSEEANLRQVRHQKMTTDLDAAKKKRTALQKELAEVNVGRDETPERTAKLQKLEQLETENQSMTKELQSFADNNPLLIKAMQEDAKVAREAANRWTDNIFSMRSFCEKSFNMDSATFEQNFEVPADIDYVN